MPLLTRKMKDGFWNVLSESQAYHLLRPWYGGLGTILTFHRVVEPEKGSPLRENRDLEVSPIWLEQIVSYLLTSGYEIVSLDELSRRLMQNGNQKRFVCFSFDDGYRDNLTLAYPIFKKHNVPFALYVTTSFQIELLFFGGTPFKISFYLRAKSASFIKTERLCRRKINCNAMTLFPRSRRSFCAWAARNRLI